MKRLHAWAIAALLSLELRIVSAFPGWVVMCEDPYENWHAMSGGADFGMDLDTGRFPDRESARRFCRYRNAESLDKSAPYYVAHERVLNRPLPPDYR